MRDSLTVKRPQDALEIPSASCPHAAHEIPLGCLSRCCLTAALRPAWYKAVKGGGVERPQICHKQRTEKRENSGTEKGSSKTCAMTRKREKRHVKEEAAFKVCNVHRKEW